MRTKINYILIIFGALCASSFAAEDVTHIYQLNDILNMAVLNSPRINSSLANIDAARGGQLQASLPINPNIVLETENFAGKNELSGFQGAELTASVQQTIEIAGKKHLRTEVARYNSLMIEQQSLADMLKVLLDAEIGLKKYLLAQKRLKLIKKRLKLTDDVHDTIEKRVKAAASSDIQHTKIDIERKSALLEQTNAQRDLTMAEISLNKLIAKDISKIPLKKNLLLNDLDIPSEAETLAQIKNIPQQMILELQCSLGKKV